METTPVNTALITNDAVVFGILMTILALVFYTSSRKEGFWNKFYKYVPSVLLCYFIPALFNTFGIISGENSGLYSMASRYLLPASLILLTLGIDMKGLRRLGPKSIIMFFAGTLGVIIGGPIAFATVGSIFPDIFFFGEEETWRGLSTVSGSWIGGGANQDIAGFLIDTDRRRSEQLTQGVGNDDGFVTVPERDQAVGGSKIYPYDRRHYLLPCARP